MLSLTLPTASPSRSKPAPTWPYPGLPSLQGCSAMGLSVVMCFEVFQHDLIYCHSCFKVCQLQHGLTLEPQSLQRYTCCATDSHGQRCFDVYLLWLGLMQGHSCCTDSSMSPRLFNSSAQRSPSLSSTAAEKQQDALPICQTRHLCCDQQNTVRLSAVQQAAKPKAATNKH